ncbi:MAG: Lrp/AsnC family transcriptional regulator [Candidatus Woesearchaeota archaeon]
MKEKELTVMRQLRANARETLTKMSRRTGIPVSTIYEWLKGFESKVITKHTCLLNFRELGFDLRVTLLIQTQQEQKGVVQQFLQTHHRVNSVFRINNGYDFLAEVLFKTMIELQEFLDALDKKGVKQRQEYYILDEICKENFLSHVEHADIMQAV